MTWRTESPKFLPNLTTKSLLELDPIVSSLDNFPFLCFPTAPAIIHTKHIGTQAQYRVWLQSLLQTLIPHAWIVWHPHAAMGPRQFL